MSSPNDEHRTRNSLASLWKLATRESFTCRFAAFLTWPSPCPVNPPLSHSLRSQFMLGPPLGTSDPKLGDQACKFSVDEPVVFCNPITAPTVVSSGVPLLTSAGRDVVVSAVVGGPPVTFTLPGDANSELTISTPPSLGAVLLTATTATYTPPLTSSALSDTFSYSDATDSAQVRVVFSSPPISRDVALSLVEDGEGESKLGRRATTCLEPHMCMCA